MSRIISWFSCGAASAVATKLALNEYGDKVEIYCCEVREEHPDNHRFLLDCEKWFGREIHVIGNDDFDRSIFKVFEKRKYMSGVYGAPCTGELKKKVRESISKPDDINVFGYTAEEQNRYDRFIDSNNDVAAIAPLIDAGLKKQDCLAIIEDAGIDLPKMYKLGYNNNNCIGCVKASSVGYWKKIKHDFPDQFEKTALYEEKIGCKLCKYTLDGKPYRVSLRNLPDHIPMHDDSVDSQCGIFCHLIDV
jgi:hypothetical protein